MPLHYERRMARLVKATNHVARYYQLKHLTCSKRLWDAVAVVRMYQKGEDVRLLGREVLRRMATESYGYRGRM
jgi:hypothetical protein